MEKENKRYGPKEYTYNLKNYHLYEKKKTRKAMHSPPHKERKGTAYKITLKRPFCTK